MSRIATTKTTEEKKISMIEERLDKENLKTLLKHIEQVGYGKTLVEIGAVRGLIAYWEEKETRKGHKAPLKKADD